MGISVKRQRDYFQHRVWTPVFVAGIFLLNLFVAWPLFVTEYVRHMFSIEAAYIALTRYASENWGALTWFPLWYAGMPYQNSYQPGLPIASAAMAKALGMSPALGYHFTLGLFYCAGAVGVFFLVYRITGRRDAGLLAALFFSLLSPSAFLAPVVRHDMGSVWYARRFQALIYYGEGPNVSGLSLVPFALWGVHAVYLRMTALRFILAALALGAVILVSWPAGVVMGAGVAAYLLAHDLSAVKTRILPLAALAVAAYALVAPWDPPSTIRDNQRNSQLIGGPYHYTGKHLLLFASLLLAIGRDSLPFAARARIGHHAVQSVVDLLCQLRCAERLLGERGSAATARAFSHWHGIRHLHFAGLGLTGTCHARRSAPVLFFPRGPSLRFVSSGEALPPFLRPADATVGRDGYRGIPDFAVVRRPHAGQRVFAAGSTAFWLNAWSDTPQVTGCCLPGLPNPMGWIVGYAVPSGDGAGPHDAEYALLWLRAFGAQAVAVGGAGTRDSYRDWRNGNKFEGVLPKLWESGGDRIYGIPSRTTSLAHVMEPGEIVARAPVNGLDVAPLLPFVHALEDPARPVAEWKWLGRAEASISADFRAGQVLSVQETYSPGWHASVAGRPVPLTRDGLGLMAIEPRCVGRCTVSLTFDGGTEAKLLRAACWMTMLVLLGWLLFEYLGWWRTNSRGSDPLRS